MGAGEDLLDQLVRTKAGYAQEDFFEGLEAWGYVLVRHARHGAFFRHPELAEHPNVEVRRELAYLSIPKGKQLRPYVARLVQRSIETLIELRAFKELVRKTREQGP